MNLSKLCSYYIECLSKDADFGVSVIKKDFKVNFFPLENLPLGNSVYHSINIEDQKNSFKKSYALKIGYPISLSKNMSKAGYLYEIYEPVFLFNIDEESFYKNKQIFLTDDYPELNPDFVKKIYHTNANDTLIQIQSLYKEFEMYDTENIPSIRDICKKINSLDLNWNIKEIIDPENLTEFKVNQDYSTGIHNIGMLFKTEKSPYTHGLEMELLDLSKLKDKDIENTALFQWITNNITTQNIEVNPLLEPLPLNEEQRMAINSSLKNSLTVISGPPGTGKSQVVVNLILNAVYQGQKVLFSSKNHKAIDVVYNKINKLSDKKILLKLGDKSITAELAYYFADLLTFIPSESEINEFNEYLKLFNSINNDIKNIWNKLENSIKLRNRIDEYEQNIEDFRTLISKELFSSILDDFEDNVKLKIEELNKAYVELLNIKKIENSFLRKYFWFCIKKKVTENYTSFVNKYNNLLKSIEITQLPEEYSKLSTLDIDHITFEINKRAEILNILSIYKKMLLDIKSHKTIFELTKEETLKIRENAEVSNELWQRWVRSLSLKFKNNEREVIGNFIAILNLISEGSQKDNFITNGTWSKYYSLLPKVIDLLPCWTVTSLSARKKVPFNAGLFDLVIIDESSQCDIASILPLLFRAKRAVILGDEKQLSHISSITKSQDQILIQKYDMLDHSRWSYSSSSLFSLASSLCQNENLIVLKEHHRSHSDIINYSNKYYYNNVLRVATKYSNLKFPLEETSIRWIDIKGECKKTESGSYHNFAEISEIVKLLKQLVNSDYRGSIGVVTPFRSQAEAIKKVINKDQSLFEKLLKREFICDTVHLFQGDERDVIIFSSVVSNGTNDSTLLFLKRTSNLFNVAITRARSSFTIVGDKRFCLDADITYFKNFIEYINENQTPSKYEPGITYGEHYPITDRNIYVSEWEIILYEALYKIGIKAIPQYKESQYCLDLAIILKTRKLNIEIDGEMYHKDWNNELLKKDVIRNRRLEELGWDVMRFWVYEIRDNLQECIERVKKWVD